MKKRYIITLLFSIVLFACKKEEDAAVSSSGYTAKVDNVTWKAASVKASIFNGTMVVVGVAPDGSTITFSLNGDSVGLYPVNENTNSSATFTTKDGKKNGFSSGGSATAGGQILIEDVSLKNKKITGSIDFKAVRNSDDSTIVISDGRFVAIRYDNIPVGLEENTLKAQVNGSSWSPSNVSGFLAFKTLYLQALDADGIRKLTFEIPELIGPGKYTLNYFTDYRAAYISVANKKHYAVSGTLEIISHNLVNRQIQAKFDVITEAHEDGGFVRFTEGDFDIIYE